VIAVLAAAAVATAGVQARIDDLVVTIRDQRTRVETTQTRSQRSVAVPSDVLFAFDSARLTARGRATLRGLERVRIVAAGESRPVASNRAAAGRSRNRRVEIAVG
jgi:outer membrane protein OmpA-like peptidoglycan-associated protein